MADKPGGLLASRLEKGADRSLVKFSKRKLNVLHVGRKSPKYQYKLGATRLESSFPEKYLEDNMLAMSWQCAFGAKQASSILGCVRQSITSSLRRCFVCFWVTWCKTDVDILESPT